MYGGGATYVTAGGSIVAEIAGGGVGSNGNAPGVKDRLGSANGAAITEGKPVEADPPMLEGKPVDADGTALIGGKLAEVDGAAIEDKLTGTDGTAVIGDKLDKVDDVVSVDGAVLIGPKSRGRSKSWDICAGSKRRVQNEF